MRILILEDNEGDFILLRKQLKQIFPSIETSPQLISLEEAERLFVHDRNYHVIFTDLHLQDSNGLNTLKRLKQLAPEIPIIVLSGLDDEIMLMDAVHSGAQDYLIKGNIDNRSLRKSIQYSIERQRLMLSMQGLRDRYHHILHATSEALWEFEIEPGKLVLELVNQTHSGLFNQYAGHPIDLLQPSLSPEALSLQQKHFQSVLFQSDQQVYRTELILNIEEPVYLEMTCHITRDDKARPVKVYGSFHDITRIKLANSETAMARMKYTQLFSHHPLPSFVYDRETLQILECNMSALKKYGYDDASLQNMIISELWPMDQQVAITKTLIAGDYPTITRHYTQHSLADGQTIHVSIEFLQSDQAGRRVMHLMAVDVTEKIRLEQQMLQAQIEQQNLVSRSVIRAQEDERHNIGRELHDNVNQLLTSAVLNLQMVHEDDPAGSFVLRSKSIIQKSISEIRKLSKELSTPVVAEVGLIDAITELIDDINNLQSIQFQFTHPTLIELDHDLNVNLFRIVQEQLNNTVKYSQARVCRIQLVCDAHQVELNIEDDGIGMNKPSEQHGIGLRNIQNRCSIYGGAMQLFPSETGGFGIKVQIPLTRPVQAVT